MSDLRVGDIVKFPNTLIKTAYTTDGVINNHEVKNPIGTIVSIESDGENTLYVVKISESFGSVVLTDEYLQNLKYANKFNYSYDKGSPSLKDGEKFVLLN